MLRVLLDYKSLNYFLREDISPYLMAFTKKAIFLYLSIQTTNFAQDSNFLKIAVLDTGFCPEQTYKNPNIIIEPVKDVTQSNSYKCNKSSITNPRFHGQQVLDVFSFHYPHTPGTRKLLITPIIIFDKNALQNINYWNQALSISESHDLIISAVGLPLPKKEEERKKILKLAQLPKPLTLLASGRISSEISKETLLFPQEFHRQRNIKLIGSYHTPLFKDSLAIEDSALLYKQSISLYFPYSEKFRPLLKGASRALAIGSAKIVDECFVQIKSTNADLLETCLNNKKERILLKNKSLINYGLK